MTENLKEYFALMKERPELFVQNENLMIETDIEKIKEYETCHNKKIGVVYKSPYNMFIVDLVRNLQGYCFTYERCVPAVKKGAIVSIPVYDGRFVLLKQFRHATRKFQYAFPRGFGEKGLSSEENLKKEIMEEIGSEVISSTFLGNTVSNSGLSSDSADVFYCEVTQPVLKKGYEEITNIELLSADEIKQWISQNKIDDGFTTSALCMYFCSDKIH